MTTSPSPRAVPWVSFIADDGDTWLFDLSFFASNWNCIYGHGCAGIEQEEDVEGHKGCCSYGAHFADDDDLHRVMAVAAALPTTLWQHHAHRPDGVDDPKALAKVLTEVDDDGDRTTLVVDGACVFQNRPDFELGPGCAFHVAADATGIDPLEWKPEVCWQLPIRVEHHVDDNGAHTHMVRQWERRDWGEAGADLAWWCSEAPEAYSGDENVARYLHSEVAALAGASVADALIDHVENAADGVSVSLGPRRSAEGA